MATRHRVDNKNPSAQEILARQVWKYDKAELSRLLLEVCLLDSAYQRGTNSAHDPLMDAAKRYRVDTEKIAKAVAEASSLKQKERAATPARKTPTEQAASAAQPRA